MTAITAFTNTEFGEVRTMMRDGEPWFVAADVCRALELTNNRMAVDRLDEDEKADVSLTDTSSNGVTQSRTFTIINEAGLYALVLGSRNTAQQLTSTHPNDMCKTYHLHQCHFRSVLQSSA
jgi:prophage antirepressor-like protein